METSKSVKSQRPDLVGQVVNAGNYAEGIILLARQSWVNLDEVIVLCIIPRQKEFVTWLMDENQDTFHGHYYLGLEEAIQDFHKRG